MKIFLTQNCIVIEKLNRFFSFEDSWDELINRPDLSLYLNSLIKNNFAKETRSPLSTPDLLPPIVSQEVWGAGVTYLMSREARKEESQDAGGGSFYHQVYTAERPEIFWKANRNRVVGSGQNIRIRRDSSWNVPEPELTALLSRQGDLVGFTVGNDVSSRDIEGENPLYLPQAKVFDGCCSIGPGLLVTEEILPARSKIILEVIRSEKCIFRGETRLENMKRSIKELTDFLFRECSFPFGCFLMTGTGIIPPSDFSLQTNDVVRISIDNIGTLVNTVSTKR